MSLHDEFLQRLALAREGRPARSVAKAAGLNPSMVRDITERMKTTPSLDTVAALARALEVSPAWLGFGISDGTPAPAQTPARNSAIPLVGTVSGGVWREVDSLDQDEQPPSPFLPDARWPPDKQFALRVEGESINRIARDGDLIAVVAVEALEKPPANGALVIVEEARDDGALIRTTAKRLHARGKIAELHADSDDPRWRDVRLVIEPDTGDARLITTRIVGLVTAVHKALA